MKRDAALKILKNIIKDDIVVSVYQTCFDWMAINPRDLNYVSTGAMGQASSHGLGLALTATQKRVFVFDGDGSLLMNLGSLVTIGHNAPQNFYHFVFVNGEYEVNGKHPTPGADKIDFAAMAKACGYQDSISFSSLVDFRDNIDDFLSGPGPLLIALDVEAGESYPRNYDYIHSEQARQRFKKALRST